MICLILRPLQAKGKIGEEEVFTLIVKICIRMINKNYAIESK